MTAAIPLDEISEKSTCLRGRSTYVERLIRPQVLTRKNCLFAGHDAGGEFWAVLGSLIETCKLQNVEPQAYLTDVLTRLVNLWPNDRLDELLPWAWPATVKASPVTQTGRARQIPCQA